MPQSSVAIRQKAEALRILRNPHAQIGRHSTSPLAPIRAVWAKSTFACHHGTCLALEVRNDGLWVKVRDAAGAEAFAPVARVLSPDQRREWARRGFG